MRTLTKSLTDAETTVVQKQWEADGFKFIGNGFETNDDDPELCPACGEPGFFWALFEHPTRTRYDGANPQGGEYDPHLLNAINTCYECGYRWVDVDSK